MLPFPCSKCFGSILDIKQRALRSSGSTVERLHEVQVSPIFTLIPFTVLFWCLRLWRWGHSLKYLRSPHVLKENSHPPANHPSDPVGPDLPTTVEGAIFSLELSGLVCLALLVQGALASALMFHICYPSPQTGALWSQVLVLILTFLFFHSHSLCFSDLALRGFWFGPGFNLYYFPTLDKARDFGEVFLWLFIFFG